MKQITVTFHEDGSTSVETSGFDGGTCEAETAALERALGARTKNTRTPEFYRTAKAKAVNRG